MKKLLYFFSVCALLVSCMSQKKEEIPQETKELVEIQDLLNKEGFKNAQLNYEYSHIPDSLRPQMAQFIKETVSAASLHMTGGDYEDPEDVIEQAEETAEHLYARTTIALTMWSPNDYRVNIKVSDFTPRQKRIYDLIVKNGPVK